VPVIRPATKAGAAGKCLVAAGRVGDLTEYADVIVRIHTGITDPAGDNHSGPVRRCVDTYAQSGGDIRGSNQVFSAMQHTLSGCRLLLLLHDKQNKNVTKKCRDHFVYLGVCLKFLRDGY